MFPLPFPNQDLGAGARPARAGGSIVPQCVDVSVRHAGRAGLRAGRVWLLHAAVNAPGHGRSLSGGAREHTVRSAEPVQEGAGQSGPSGQCRGDPASRGRGHGLLSAGPVAHDSAGGNGRSVPPDRPGVCSCLLRRALAGVLPASAVGRSGGGLEPGVWGRRARVPDRGVAGIVLGGKAQRLDGVCCLGRLLSRADDVGALVPPPPHAAGVEQPG